MPVAICFFLSGAAALILQVLWTRMIGHVFGATTLAVSTTLSAFMGGLALGSHLAGRFAPKVKQPLLAFAVLETTVGFYGLLVPTLLGLMPALQRAVGVDLGPSFLGYSLFRFVIVTLILILPTTAMGATLPLLAEGIVASREHMASRTTRLYAANTFGAVAGAFLAGFVFIPQLGLTKTVYLAASLDLIVAGIVLVLWRVAGGSELLTKHVLEESADEILTRLEPVEVRDVTGTTRTLVFFAFAVSGAAAMALEVLGTRSVGVVIGASTYSFTLILTTFLVGLALGAAIMTRYIDAIPDPVKILAWIEIAVGAFSIIGAALVDKLPLWMLSVASARDLSFNGLYFSNFAIAAVVTLPATLALGAVMPLVLRILVPFSGERPSELVGKAYAVNTLGAIAGSFLAGFVVVPIAGVERGLMLTAATSIAVGLMLAFTRKRGRTPLIIAAVVASLLLVAVPRWDVRTWTSGLFRLYLARSVYESGWAPSAEIVYHRDGIATTVTVEREGGEGGGVSLKVNGKVDASDGGDMPTQVLSGLLPMLIHPGAEDVLVIGYGSGVTPGAILQTPVKSLHVAELEASVLEASNTFFKHVNHEPAKDPRARLVVDDGRNFLLTQNNSYDVIVSEPSNPWMSGAASLFTHDFFEIAKRRLRKGGLFLQWLQLYELGPDNIYALVRTFHSVFPYVLVFSPEAHSNDTLLVGADFPVHLERERLTKAMADPKIKAELARAGVDDIHDLFGLYLLGSDEVPEFAGKGELNTDDNAMIEFQAPRDLLTYATRDARLPFLEAVDGKRLELTAKYFTGFKMDGEELGLIADRLLRQGRISDAEAFLSKAQELGFDSRRTNRLLALVTEEDSQPVVVVTPETKADPRYAEAVLAMTHNHERQAIDILDRSKGIENASTSHRFLYAYLSYRLDRDADAEFLMEKVLNDGPFVANNPPVLYYAGRILFVRGKSAQGIKHLEAFIDVESEVGDQNPSPLEINSMTEAPSSP